MSLGRQLARRMARPLARALVTAPAVTFDADAETYFTASGVSDATTKQDVTAWFLGLKALGVYSSIAEMFTLRSTQNAGTGTTLFGMKRAVDGTLTNGPTWGANGITFDGSNDYINLSGATGIFQNVGTGWMVAVARDTSPSAGATHIAAFVANNTTASRATIITCSTANRFQAIGRRLDADSIATSETANSANCAYLENRSNWTGNSVGLVVDGSAIATAAYASGGGNTSNTASGSVRLGTTGGGANPFPGEISLFLMSASLPSLAVCEQVRDLYKNTIGKGLGLP